MNIPVPIEYKGKQTAGYLSSVNGAGSSSHHYHFMINNYYQGQLCYTESRDEWRFTSQTGQFEDLTDYFVNVLICWYE